MLDDLATHPLTLFAVVIPVLSGGCMIAFGPNLLSGMLLWVGTGVALLCFCVAVGMTIVKRRRGGTKS